MNEIISPSYPDYFPHDDFLSQEEQTLLHPDYDSGHTSINDYRHIDPDYLQRVFEKVLNYLKHHHDDFPLIHNIYVDRMRTRGGGGSPECFQYNGYKCYLDGYHNKFEHRQEIPIRGLKNGWETVEWVRADPIIVLGGKTFYIVTENKYEQFKDILEELITICDEAIKTDKKLLWTFSN